MGLDGHQAPPIPSRPIVRKPRPSQPAGFSFFGCKARLSYVLILRRAPVRARGSCTASSRSAVPPHLR